MVTAAVAGLVVGAVASLVTRDISALVAATLFCPSFVYLLPPKRESLGFHLGLAAFFVVTFTIVVRLIQLLEGR